MALTENDLAQLEALLGSAAVGENPLANFRQRFPGLSLTRCDASDMGGDKPFRTYPGFELYLVDGSNHCWRITGDPTIATGIVVAQRC